MKKISVVTGVFNEELLVRDVYEAIKKTFSKLPKYNYEHIFMDNCSTDATLSILKTIAKKDKRVKILSYSRNFGPEKSGFTGLIHTSGDAVIPYEGSMKDPASLIPTFIKYWEDGHQLVYGVRNKTRDNPLLSFARKIFYRLERFLASDELPLNVGSFCLIDKIIVDEIKKIDDYNPYLRGLVTTAGFNKKAIVYQRNARPKGKGHSKSSLRYLIDFAINGIINYSILPMRICTYIGLFLSLLSFLSAVIYLSLKIFYWKVTVPGLTGVIFLIFIFAGIQLFFLGVMGEYIGAIHSQVRRKYFVIIREKINFD
ncbi:glycosyltransferase family 2 protein [Candidatus Gottesmanbacteria bacterium]|nr:glycosyltransferase family 2 protein [Candidatus Gottesmanbacteria bacterium]